MKRGVIYIATGDEYVAEAMVSVESLKKHNPDLHCTLFTDKLRGRSEFDEIKVLQDPQFSQYDKCLNIFKTPYQETLYLDSDTYICGDLTPFFEALEYCDVTGTIECARGFWYKPHSRLPEALCDINTGVICFKSTDSVLNTFREWYSLCLQTKNWLKEYGQSKWMLTLDQPAFRELLWRNRQIRLGILPEEFNALRLFGTRLWGRALIVHGRGDIARVAGELNEFPSENRVYLQGAGTLLAFQDIGLLKSLSQIFRMFVLVLYFQIKRVLKPVRGNRSRPSGKT
jgi:hypothetical protein